MRATIASHPTLMDSAQKYGAQTLRNILLVLAGTMLLYLSAKLTIPLDPVPFSMQTFVVLTLGVAYGWKLGALTIMVYLMEGAIGLPVFAQTPEKGIGLAYIAGPTGGYLIGFIIAAGTTGYLAERGWDRNVTTTAMAMFLGNVAIYVPGLTWLSTLFGFEAAIKHGLLPFITGDLVKLALAAAVLPLCWKYLGQRSRD